MARRASVLAWKIMEKGATARAFLYMFCHAFRLISAKRICYILFIGCINLPSNCSQCPRISRSNSIASRRIPDSSLENREKRGERERKRMLFNESKYLGRFLPVGYCVRVCGLFFYNVKLLFGLYNWKIIYDNILQCDKRAKKVPLSCLRFTSRIRSLYARYYVRDINISTN